MTMTIGGGVHIAMACGLLAGVWPGFASAADLQSLSRVQQSLAAVQQQMLVQQLDSDIFQTRQEQCTAKSPEAKLVYLQRLQDKLEAFDELKTNRHPRIPDCSEFGPS